MSHSRPNIYLLLRDEIKVFDTLIDVGCNGLKDLLSFEDTPFKKIIGIDKEFTNPPYKDYLYLKTFSNTKLSEVQFENKFTIFHQDFKDFEFGSNCNGLIICNKVLHFFPEAEKMIFIRQFYNSLKPEGLLYLKLNHTEHLDNTNPENTIRIAENTYQSIKNPSEVRYLVDKFKFISNLEKDFSVLNRYSDLNAKTVSVVLRK